MSSAELIGKMGAGVMRFDDTARGTAGASLSKAELAGVLATLSVHEMNLALAKYAYDELARRKLVANVQAWACELAVKEGWKPRSSELLRAIAALSVHEVVDGGLCDKCNGSGLVRIHVCKSCNGLGHRRMSGRKKAEVIGIDEKWWRTIWKVRYELVFDYVQNLEGAVLKRLHFAEFEKIETEYFKD
jgi:hypothetical protein